MYCGNIDIRQDSNNNKALTGILRPFKKWLYKQDYSAHCKLFQPHSMKIIGKSILDEVVVYY
jgi:hypothetical protein